MTKEEKKKDYMKEYRNRNKEKIKTQRKEYRDENKDKIKEYHNAYKEHNIEKINEQRKEYRKENSIKIKNYNKYYHNNNKEKINQTRRKYLIIKNNDDVFKLKNTIRLSILKSFNGNGYTKKSRTQEILGCTFEEFKIHIESQFEDWMNWDNRGNPKDGILEPNKTWDIDHIIPTCTAKTEEDMVKLNHFTNLRPLCSYTNRVIKRGN